MLDFIKNKLKGNRNQEPAEEYDFTYEEKTEYVPHRTQMLKESFRMIVGDVVSVSGGIVARGCVSDGKLTTGDFVDVIDDNGARSVRVDGIEVDRKLIRSVQAGDVCGIMFRSNQNVNIRCGDVISK